MPLAPSKHPLAEDSHPPLYAGRKLRDVDTAVLWTWLHKDPQCPSRVRLDQVAQRQAPMAVSVRQRHRLRATGQRHRRKGRPRPVHDRLPVAPGAAVVQMTPRLSCVGVPLCAHGREPQETLGPVVAQLQQALEAHKHAPPEEDLALVPHREQTLRRRFQALFLAPLVGLDRLPRFDTHEPPLPPRVGRGSHSATWTQCLGHLERIDAAAALLPALVPEQAGQSAAVDGHRSAGWRRVPRHQGTSTMRGRIMAGSQAVIAPNELGQALLVTDSPPAMPWSQVMVAYGHKVVEASGMALLGIDRAGNARALARVFETPGWGLLWRLDDHEPHGLASFAATQVGPLADGTPVSSGPWQVPRPEEPRPVVLGEPAAGQTLVSWGPPTVQAAFEATEWPRGYRERTETQEHSGKRMIAPGALKPNDGRTKQGGPDRHQRRAREKLETSREAAQQRVGKQAKALKAHQDQVAESASTGQGTRLAQRQHALVGLAKERKDAPPTQDQLAAHVAALGPPRERADRAFRTQTLRTFRTLFLEHALRACLVVLLGTLHTKGSLERVLSRLFERSGARREMDSQVVYWVNTAGVSGPYRRLLTEVVDGLWAMDVREQGQPIRVCLKDMPP